jgi:hypothetical protein
VCVCVCVCSCCASSDVFVLCTLSLSLSKIGPQGSPVVRRAVVVTPNSLVKNWAKEIKKWLSSARLIPFVIGESLLWCCPCVLSFVSELMVLCFSLSLLNSLPLPFACFSRSLSSSVEHNQEPSSESDQGMVYRSVCARCTHHWVRAVSAERATAQGHSLRPDDLR